MKHKGCGPLGYLSDRIDVLNVFSYHVSIIYIPIDPNSGKQAISRFHLLLDGELRGCPRAIRGKLEQGWAGVGLHKPAGAER